MSDSNMRYYSDLPWRSAITKADPRRTYATEIMGGSLLALVIVALVVAGFCL